MPRHECLEGGITPRWNRIGFLIEDYTCVTYAGPMANKTMSFAEQLKAVRRRERFSQAIAAQLIHGLSTRTLQAWECGRQSPPVWAQSLVLEALGGAPYDPAKKRSVSPARKARQGKRTR